MLFRSQTGAVAGPSNITIYAKKDVKDTSCYTEKGALKIPMANEEQMFLRPAIIAGIYAGAGIVRFLHIYFPHGILLFGRIHQSI